MYALARPGDRLVHHLAPTHHPGLPLRTQSEAVDWLFTEARCLLATAAQACHSADPTALRRAVDLLLAPKDLAESGAHARPYADTAACPTGRTPSASSPPTSTGPKTAGRI
ncbi:hypothetical protein [Streptomyces triculaminicus]|uniref:hypothetical protein n=1 Tax=Streptomyces triculaminicus TaxID=2816232 RepID=UPI003F4D21E2